MKGETQEKIVSIGFMALGAFQMLIHPRKTYALVVHKIGWHD